MSYVRRPSRRASVPSYAAAICAPATSSMRGACQPPNGNPTGSSSGPPGACPTRSRVANISMWMRPMRPPGCLGEAPRLATMTFEGFPEAAFDFYDDLEVDNTKTFWDTHKHI